jgi:hypothetical protein
VAPLKAAALHRLASQELGPTLTALGFARTPSTTAGWARPAGDRWLVIWLQPWRSAGSPASGEFTVELRLSSRPETGGDGQRRRLPTLLTPAELEELRRHGRTVAHGPDDVWLLQKGEADAQALLTFVAQALPSAIQRFGA